MNRQYAQGVARFSRVDTSMGSVALPQSLNRYSYVTNNPVNAVDRLGLFPSVISFPPICPVVNGVAMCGSLGAINVNAGNSSGGLGANGGGSDSDQILIEGGHGPNAETEIVQSPTYQLTPCEEQLLDTWSIKDKAILYQTRAEAFDRTSGLPGQHNGLGDAVRHCVWSCLMAQNLGQDKARAEGAAHECPQPGDSVDAKREHEMDTWNNGIGREIGEREDVDCYQKCKRDPRLKKNIGEIPPPPGS